MNWYIHKFVWVFMAIVETIFVRLRTRDAPKAGTDASVYVGIGGREFCIDSRDPDFDDFERNDDRTYILGKKPNVLPSPNPEYIYSQCMLELT